MHNNGNQRKLHIKNKGWRIPNPSFDLVTGNDEELEAQYRSWFMLVNIFGQCALDQKMEGRAGIQSKDRWNQMGCEEKKVVVHKEMKRMSQLPANSSYATHRLRVLNKILQLLSLQRSTSQDEELELLFTGLHL